MVNVILDKRLSNGGSVPADATLGQTDSMRSIQTSQIKKVKALVQNQVNGFRKSDASQSYDIEEAVNLIKEGMRPMVKESELELVHQIVVDEHMEPSLLDHGQFLFKKPEDDMIHEIDHTMIELLDEKVRNIKENIKEFHNE